MEMPKTKDPHAKDIIENQMVQTQEMHCQACGRFLGYQAIMWGVVRIKCKCKQWNTIDISPEHEV